MTPFNRNSITCAVMVVLSFAMPARSSDVVSGAAQVIDADILRIDKQRVILWGLDAPERNQPCFKDGRKWGCHGAARRTLELLAGRGEVVCYMLGDPDPFNRRHGVCESGGIDINAEMVGRGMAVAWEEQTSDYVGIQLDAIENERGIWSVGVEFQLPWEYRLYNTPGGFR